MNIYKSMSAAFNANFCQPRAEVSLSGVFACLFDLLNFLSHLFFWIVGNVLMCAITFLEIKRSTTKGLNFDEKIIENKSQNGDVQNVCTSKPCSTRDAVLPDQVLCSPPSSAGPKYSDDDSNDRGSVHVSSNMINSDCTYEHILCCRMKT